MIIERKREREKEILCVCMRASVRVCVYVYTCAFDVKEAGKQKGCARMDERRKSRNKECERALHLAPDGLRTEYIRSFPILFVCLRGEKKKKRKTRIQRDQVGRFKI